MCTFGKIPVLEVPLMWSDCHAIDTVSPSVGPGQSPGGGSGGEAPGSSDNITFTVPKKC